MDKLKKELESLFNKRLTKVLEHVRRELPDRDKILLYAKPPDNPGTYGTIPCAVIDGEEKLQEILDLLPRCWRWSLKDIQENYQRISLRAKGIEEVWHNTPKNDQLLSQDLSVGDALDQICSQQNTLICDAVKELIDTANEILEVSSILQNVIKRSAERWPWPLSNHIGRLLHILFAFCPTLPRKELLAGTLPDEADSFNVAQWVISETEHRESNSDKIAKIREVLMFLKKRGLFTPVAVHSEDLWSTWAGLAVLYLVVQEIQARSTRSILPSKFPQQTFMEARDMAIAITDGKTGHCWEDIVDEVALRHARPDDHLQTKLIAGPALDWWGLPATYESLRREIRSFEISTVLLLNITIGCVLEIPQSTANIDDLIRMIGWQPRSRKEREQMRRKVWRWMLIFDSMSVHGRRPGKYKDPYTKKEIDLTSTDALIKITGKRFDGQQLELDGSSVPLEVTFVAGPWLDQFRGNEKILHYFGDIRKIAEIPAGKASGVWAQSIALTLNQKWREQAAQANVHHVGESNKLTAAFRPFTRFELLDIFRCEPWVEDVLNGPNPQRARTYWEEAIKILRRAGIIGYSNELKGMPEIRKGWQTFWLKEQPLDIRPKGNDIERIAEIAGGAKRAKRKSPTKRAKQEILPRNS